MLISVIVFGSIKSVTASDPLYYYERYKSITNYTEELGTVTSTHSYIGQTSYHSRGDEGDHYFNGKLPGYSGIVIGSNGNVSLVGALPHVGIGQYLNSKIGIAKIIERTGGYEDTYYDKSSDSDVIDYWEILKIQNVIAVPNYKKGDFEDIIKGTFNQYLNDGLHSDGYWYIRKGLVNENPILTLNSPGENSYFGKEAGKNTISLQATVKDVDIGDVLTSYYRIDGSPGQSGTLFSTISSNGNNQTITGIIPSSTITALSEGQHTLYVWTNDNKGGTSGEKSIKFFIDKTAPTEPIINTNEKWSKEDVSVSIVSGTDSGGSGVERTEYMLGGSTILDWTTYTTGFPILNEGITVIKSRTIDKVGNISPEVSKIVKIDKTKPSLAITNNDTNWYDYDVPVNISHSDVGGSGVHIKRYLVTDNTVKPSDGWIDLTSTNQDIEISNEGYNYIHAQIADGAGNETYQYVGPFKIDKTPPIVNNPVLSNIKSNSITVTTDATDSGSGLKDSETYLFNRDGEDITSFIIDKFVVDSNLKSNREYSYKYKAKDNVENVSDYSLASKNYTLALNPIKVILKEVTGTSITLDVKNNTENINIPETIIELKEKGGNTTVSSSNWGIDTTKTLTGLIPGKEYEVYINTRNGDKVENGSIKIPNPDISFEDEFGNPIITITTVIPVENYNISGSSVNTLSVSWDQESNQEYQVFLKDEFNNEIARSGSLWIKNNQHIFDNLPLPNTRYVPYITTRRINSTSSLTPTKVLNEEKAYTNAEGISRGSFESGEDFIEVTLILDSLKNPHDTEYELKNDVTGQVTKVLHSNPIWKNTNLAKESYYTYSVRAINKNSEPSYFTKLVFINGEDPHTYIPDLDIGDDIIDKPGGDIIDLDELEDWDSDKPIWFNPEDLDGKEVKIDDEVFIVTKNKMATIKNKEKIEVANYAFSKEGFGFTDWKELKEGFFEDKIYFNQPGYYKTHFKFKNHVRESKPLILNYIADWIAPDIIAENKIKGQSVVTGNDFEIRLSAGDNISKFLFYSVDDGKTYYHLKDENSHIMFTDIERTTSGVQNKLKIKVADICGNIKEQHFTIWGVNK